MFSDFSNSFIIKQLVELANFIKQRTGDGPIPSKVSGGPGLSSVHLWTALETCACNRAGAQEIVY